MFKGTHRKRRRGETFGRIDSEAIFGYVMNVMEPQNIPRLFLIMFFFQNAVAKPLFFWIFASPVLVLEASNKRLETEIISHRRPLNRPDSLTHY